MSTHTAKAAMGDATTISVPEELADELYERKGRGETYADVIERLLEAADGATPPPMDDGPTGGRREETRHAAPHAEETDADGEEEPSDAGAEGDTLEALVDDVAGEVLPGSGEKLEDRCEAFAAVVDYLREHGGATPADLRREVYPEHRGHYTSGKDPARSWWKNSMYPALRELAERTDAIEKADESGTWSYADDVEEE